MSAGMDALTISNLLPPGKLRTHAELIKAAGFGGARMRAAISLAAKEGLVESITGRGSDWRVPQCWKGIANA